MILKQALNQNLCIIDSLIDQDREPYEAGGSIVVRRIRIRNCHFSAKLHAGAIFSMLEDCR